MAVLDRPGAHQIPENDPERGGELKTPTEINVNPYNDSDIDAPDSSFNHSKECDIPPTPQFLKDKLARWNAKVEGLGGLEARGIMRVLHEEKHNGGVRGYVQMAVLWFSINMCANNIITGLLGPLVFQLGWVDSICIVIFATGLSACAPAYTSTFGPESGNRTMVRIARMCFLMQTTCVLQVVQ